MNSFTYLDGKVTQYIGDVFAVLAGMEADSVDCVVCSPPYWGLRSYLRDDDPDKKYELGLEPTLGEHLAKMVEVFEAVRRVLKPTGTLWLNYGDCYATSPNGRSAADTKAAGNDDRTFRDKPFSTVGGVLKPKDLCMVPNRLAIALQEPKYQGEITNIEDRVWLAAMIDAEGCLFIHRRKTGQHNGAGYYRKNDSFSVGLEISNTSEAIVRKCQQITGVGSIFRHEKDRRQPLFRWNLRTNECRRVIEEIYPHLVAKQHQARLVLGCPSSGDDATNAHAALIALHRGGSSQIDFPAPPSMFKPGWYVRSENIWAKPNPMPESIRDRPATSHEKVFLLTKSARYFYDAEAVRQRAATASLDRWSQNVDAQEGSHRAHGGAKTNGTMEAVVGPRVTDKQRGHSRRHAGFNDCWDAMKKVEQCANGRNLRNYEPAPLNVWNIATRPFSEAHFATFPPELAARCIKAGCPAGGTVLDPFGGAGTTALVASRLGRRSILIELNPEYAGIARRRIEADWCGPDERKARHISQAPADDLPMFAALREAAE